MPADSRIVESILNEMAIAEIRLSHASSVLKNMVSSKEPKPAEEWTVEFQVAEAGLSLVHGDVKAARKLVREQIRASMQAGK
jgi:hypothetical protein